MFLSVNEINPGKIYKTMDNNYPYAYVLSIYFSTDTTRDQFGTITKFKESTSFFVRYLSKDYMNTYDYYGFPYEDMRNKRFINEIDLKVESDTENGFYVQINDDFKWTLENMCAAQYDYKKLYCQARPYKFSNSFVIKTTDFKDFVIPFITNELNEMISKDKIIIFDYPMYSGYPDELDFSQKIFFFKEKEDYDLIKLIFIDNLK